MEFILDFVQYMYISNLHFLSNETFLRQILYKENIIDTVNDVAEFLNYFILCRIACKMFSMISRNSY